MGVGFVCSMKGCGGLIDPAEGGLRLPTGCTSSDYAFRCPECGRLHWRNSHPVFNRQGKAAYIKEGKFLLVKEESEG